MIVKLLTEYHLEFLSLKEGCTDSSKSTHVKMPHCWKSHSMAQIPKSLELACFIQAEEMRKLSESSLKEKDTMKKHCEKEKSQMSSIMQSYKTESDNIVERKDKEIESLKQKMKKENDKSKNEVY